MATAARPDRGSRYGPAEFQAELAVSRETLDRLTAFLDLLARWQKAINLVGRATLADPWRRHVLDSAQLLPLAPAARIWLDIGSGAGFPGLVLAILLRETPGARVHLVESDARKCAFLREAARVTAAAAEIHHRRIEQMTPFTAEVITARACAPLTELLRLALPFAGPDSRCLFLKGREAGAELTAAAKFWKIEARTWPSRSDPEGQILDIQGLSRG